MVVPLRPYSFLMTLQLKKNAASLNEKPEQKSA